MAALYHANTYATINTDNGSIESPDSPSSKAPIENSNDGVNGAIRKPIDAFR